MAPLRTSGLGFGMAVDDLIAKIQSDSRLAESRGLPSTARRLVRHTVKIESRDPLQWLRSQPDSVKVYWRDRKQRFEIAGAGAADVVRVDGDSELRETFERIRGCIAADESGARYFGGMRFDPEFTDELDSPWESFGDALFVLPRFELTRDADGTRLSHNILVDSTTSIDFEETATRLRLMLFQMQAPDISLPAVISRTDFPDAENWAKNVESADRLFASGELEKIVLARKSRFEFPSPPDPWQLLTRLRDVSPSQFVFGIQPEEGTAFIGASPERLFRRIDNTIECEALAGTRPRGKTDEEDAALGEQLLESEKDRREHGYVLDTVVNTIKDLCDGEVVEDQVSLLKLPRVQHLMARFRGRLADGITDSDLLEALHPTPAVGGLPRDKAIKHIGSLERFDRGWYAGPVGWIGANSTEFAVGIRSGLIEDSSLLLYSGAGIVKGSDAASEWQEIENKMAGFLNVIMGK